MRREHWRPDRIEPRERVPTLYSEWDSVLAGERLRAWRAAQAGVVPRLSRWEMLRRRWRMWRWRIGRES